MNKQSTNLFKACRLAEIEIVDKEFNYYDSLPNYKFSKAFERRMKKLCKRAGKATFKVEDKNYSNEKHSRVVKPLKVLLIAAILIALFLVTATAISENVRNFFIERLSDFSYITFFDDNSSKGTLYSDYTWLPEGYRLVSSDRSKISEFLIYEDDSGNMITCSANKNEYSTVGINTEGVNTQDVNINGVIGIYCENMGAGMLAWGLGEYNYIVTCDNVDNVTKEDLIRIAENRKNN